MSPPPNAHLLKPTGKVDFNDYVTLDSALLGQPSYPNEIDVYLPIIDSTTFGYLASPIVNYLVDAYNGSSANIQGTFGNHSLQE
jgi:hypothetical protein